MSSIVWVLVITLNSAFSAEQVQIKFSTEHQCEQARQGVITWQRAECKPMKAADVRKVIKQ